MFSSLAWRELHQRSPDRRIVGVLRPHQQCRLEPFLEHDHKPRLSVRHSHLTFTTLLATDTNSIVHYHKDVIRSYRERDTEAVAERRRVSKVPYDVQRRAQRKLMMLNNARTINDLRVPPGNRLETLSGDRRGQLSIRINDQWRICFVWREGNAYQVEIVDYH